MDEEIKTKTVGLAETIFLVILVGTEELFEVLILLVTLGAGIMVVEVMNGATAALMEMYMIFRGGTGIKRLIIQPLGAFFDGLLGTVLPIKTVSMVIGIWMINNSEKVEKVTGPAGKVIAGGAKGAAANVGRQAVSAEAKMATAATAAATAEKEAMANASATRQRMTMATRRASNEMVGVVRESSKQASERDLEMKEAA